MNRVIKLGYAAGLAAAISLGFGSNSWANNIVATSPVIGTKLATAPNAVSVTAQTSLLDQGNSLAVTDPNGSQVDDGSLTISDTTAVVGLKPLTVSGVYTVSYTLLSATDVPLVGTFTFMYSAPATITTPIASPIPQPASSSTASTPSVHPATNSSATVVVLILVGLAFLIILFLLWYARMIWVQSRKSRKSESRKRSAK